MTKALPVVVPGTRRIARTSTPLARSRSRLSVPKSSGPTQPIIAVAAPTRAAWSAKIAGAPLGIGAGEQAGLEKGLADLGRHDLDQDLADRHDLRHGALIPLAAIDACGAASVP